MQLLWLFAAALAAGATALKFEVDKLELDEDVAKMRLKTGPYPYPHNVRHWYGKPYNMQAQSMEDGTLKIMYTSESEDFNRTLHIVTARERAAEPAGCSRASQGANKCTIEAGLDKISEISYSDPVLLPEMRPMAMWAHGEGDTHFDKTTNTTVSLAGHVVVLVWSATCVSPGQKCLCTSDTTCTTTSRYNESHDGKKGQGYCVLWNEDGNNGREFYNGDGWDCSDDNGHDGIWMAAVNHGVRIGKTFLIRLKPDGTLDETFIDEVSKANRVNAQWFVYDSAEQDDAHLIGRYKRAQINRPNGKPDKPERFEYAMFHRISHGTVTNHHWACRGTLIDSNGKKINDKMAGCAHCNGLGLMLHENTNKFSFQCSSDGAPAVGFNIDAGTPSGGRGGNVKWSKHVMGEGRMGQGNVHRTNFAATASCGRETICAVLRHTEVPYGEGGQNVWFVKWNTTSNTVVLGPKQLTFADKFGPLKKMRLTRFGGHLLMGWAEGNKWFQDMLVQELDFDGNLLSDKVEVQKFAPYRSQNWFRWSNGDVGWVGAWDLNAPPGQHLDTTLIGEAPHNSFEPKKHLFVARVSDAHHRDDCIFEWTPWTRCDEWCNKRRFFHILVAAGAAGNECPHEEGAEEWQSCFNGNGQHLVKGHASSSINYNEHYALNAFDTNWDTQWMAPGSALQHRWAAREEDPAERKPYVEPWLQFEFDAPTWVGAYRVGMGGQAAHHWYNYARGWTLLGDGQVIGTVSMPYHGYDSDGIPKTGNGDGPWLTDANNCEDGGCSRLFNITNPGYYTTYRFVDISAAGWKNIGEVWFYADKLECLADLPAWDHRMEEEHLRGFKSCEDGDKVRVRNGINAPVSYRGQLGEVREFDDDKNMWLINFDAEGLSDALIDADYLGCLCPIMDPAGGNLCTAKGVPLTPGAVTQEVCTNTPDTCEVYIEKGDENGVSDIKTCREYCAAYGMTCTAQYDDDDGCGRGTKYRSCDSEGGSTSDHICQCGRGSNTGNSGCSPEDDSATNTNTDPSHMETHHNAHTCDIGDGHWRDNSTVCGQNCTRAKVWHAFEGENAAGNETCTGYAAYEPCTGGRCPAIYDGPRFATHDCNETAQAWTACERGIKYRYYNVHSHALGEGEPCTPSPEVERCSSDTDPSDITCDQLTSPRGSVPRACKGITNEECLFECDHEHEFFAGDASRTCSGGVWTGDALVCELFICPTLDAPDFAVPVVCADREDRGGCTMECRPGWAPVNGTVSPETQACSSHARAQGNAHGQGNGWVGPELDCYELICPTLQPPAGATSGPCAGYTHGQICRHVCPGDLLAERLNGFTTVGLPQKCMQGEWHPNFDDSRTQVDDNSTDLPNILSRPGCTARQSSTYSHGVTDMIAENAIDGNYETILSYGKQNSCTATKGGPGHDTPHAYWEADFGGTFSIHQVKIWNRKDCCADKLDNAVVEILQMPPTFSTRASDDSDTCVACDDDEPEDGLFPRGTDCIFDPPPPGGTHVCTKAGFRRKGYCRTSCAAAGLGYPDDRGRNCCTRTACVIRGRGTTPAGGIAVYDCPRISVGHALRVTSALDRAPLYLCEVEALGRSGTGGTFPNECSAGPCSLQACGKENTLGRPSCRNNENAAACAKRNVMAMINPVRPGGRDPRQRGGQVNSEQENSGGGGLSGGAVFGIVLAVIVLVGALVYVVGGYVMAYRQNPSTMALKHPHSEQWKAAGCRLQGRASAGARGIRSAAGWVVNVGSGATRRRSMTGNSTDANSPEFTIELKQAPGSRSWTS